MNKSLSELEKLGPKVEGLSGRAERLDERTVNLSEQLRKFEAATDDRFDRMEAATHARFDRLEAKLDRILEAARPAPPVKLP